MVLSRNSANSFSVIFSSSEVVLSDVVGCSTGFEVAVVVSVIATVVVVSFVLTALTLLVSTAFSVTF